MSKTSLIKSRARWPRLGRPAILAGTLLALTEGGAALAATSAPTPGGHYVGSTSQKLSINVTVAKSGREFQTGRMLVNLSGPKACRGRGFIDASSTPPPAIPIKRSGRFSVNFSVPTSPLPAFPFKGRATVVFQGQFSQRGKVMTGSGQLTLSNSRARCTSGRVTFSATRTG